MNNEEITEVVNKVVALLKARKGENIEQSLAPDRAVPDVTALSEELPALQQIKVPTPQPPQTYQIDLLGQSYTFIGLKQLLGNADISKAGDRVAGLAAGDEATREAARAVLSNITLQHLFNNPLTDNQGRVDDVMRVNYMIDHQVLSEIAP